jgi:hypothetical protein
MAGDERLIAPFTLKTLGVGSGCIQHRRGNIDVRLAVLIQDIIARNCDGEWELSFPTDA